MEKCHAAAALQSVSLALCASLHLVPTGAWQRGRPFTGKAGESLRHSDQCAGLASCSLLATALSGAPAMLRRTRCCDIVHPAPHLHGEYEPIGGHRQRMTLDPHALLPRAAGAGQRVTTHH
jgi:hypothetical protein